MTASETAVLLDIDGTLIDSTYHHAVAWHRGFRRAGLTLPMWRLHRAIGMGGDRLVAAVSDEDVEDRLGDRIREAWREEYARLQSDVRPLDGAVDLVHALAETPHRVALASSGDPGFTRDAVDLLGIGDDVELVTSSEDVEASKPAADLLQTTLARMGGIRSALLVGDTPYDVEAADRAGMPCLAVRTGGFSEEELREAGAAAVTDSVADLVNVDWGRLLG